MTAANGKSLIKLLLAVHTRELKTAFFLSLSGEPEVKIVATAVNSAELLTYNRAFQPQVIVLEWELPGEPVHDILPRLSQAESSPKIFLVSKPSSQLHINKVISADNIITIDSAPEDFINALERMRASASSASK